ncbi:hypothetical protein RUM43_010251 [Polyplax serrata]|uniref:Uncharacterized protein n=1 Tax=Polyplax serrata TaxID=468196 RepID=A0AAN8P3V3_POLSC
MREIQAGYDDPQLSNLKNELPVKRRRARPLVSPERWNSRGHRTLGSVGRQPSTSRYERTSRTVRALLAFVSGSARRSLEDEGRPNLAAERGETAGACRSFRFSLRPDGSVILSMWVGERTNLSQIKRSSWNCIFPRTDAYLRWEPFWRNLSPFPPDANSQNIPRKPQHLTFVEFRLFTDVSIKPTGRGLPEEAETVGWARQRNLREVNLEIEIEIEEGAGGDLQQSRGGGTI